MELKDVILSTLAEMEEGTSTTPTESNATEHQSESKIPASSTPRDTILEDERRFLESVKERLLVLFEGFQSPNNSHIEAKVDLTLNFLEYLLATIDTRIDHIKQSER